MEHGIKMAKEKKTNLQRTCNCSVVEGELGFFVDTSGVGLRLRFLDDCCPDCGDRVLFELVVIGDVALFVELE